MMAQQLVRPVLEHAAAGVLVLSKADNRQQVVLRCLWNTVSQSLRSSLPHLYSCTPW